METEGDCDRFGGVTLRITCTRPFSAMEMVPWIGKDPTEPSVSSATDPTIKIVAKVGPFSVGDIILNTSSGNIIRHMWPALLKASSAKPVVVIVYRILYQDEFLERKTEERNYQKELMKWFQGRVGELVLTESLDAANLCPLDCMWARVLDDMGDLKTNDRIEVLTKKNGSPIHLAEGWNSLMTASPEKPVVLCIQRF